MSRDSLKGNTIVQNICKVWTTITSLTMKVDINETTFFLAFMLEERKAKSTVLALNDTKTAVVTISLTLFAFLICLILLPVPQTFMIAYIYILHSCLL